MKAELTIIHGGKRFVGAADLHPVDSEGTRPASQTAGSDAPRDVARKPSGAVDLAYRKGFFKERRALSEVVDELQQVGYFFSRQSILAALKAARFLAQTGARGSYRFVQKFPPSA
jgi:hypothetical protein